ncbi:MAG: sialate O-acetylesterase [Clostridia bacterium]|nr:sialate O-acetylesterase [Clostridia bacterium]
MKSLVKVVVAMILAIILAISATGCVGPTGPVEDPTNDPAATPTEEPTATPDPYPDIMRDDPIDAAYAADFTVSRTFSKNMVVQRGERIRVWGWADESENGKKVSGEFMGMFAEGLVEDGEWVITFKAKLNACADPGNSMRIYTDTKEVVFEDVLVGDVYMVIGQSNCAYPMSTHWAYIDKDDEERVAQKFVDDTLPIRLNYNSFQTSYGNKRGTTDLTKDIKSKSSWKKASRAGVTNFSAIGYLFAYNYVKMTDGKVPVGMIEIDGNGMPLSHFLPNEVAEKHGTDKWSEAKGYYVGTGVNAGQARYMYNEYMHPFDKMAMAGILWYQGESDLADAEASRYAAAYCDFMDYLRERHNIVNKDFPVYFVEFPTEYTQPANYKGKDPWAYMDFGKIRGIMGGMVTMRKNFFQVMSGDLWADDTFWNTLHPNCKYEQALRAAKIACAFNGEGGYTLDNASGPIIESVTYSSDGKTATIKYKNVGDGLKTVDGSEYVTGYSILTGKNKIGAKAKGKITGKDTVEVVSDSEMKGIAYNVITTYFFGKDMNLCNSAGIPAGAFLLNRE